MQNKAAVPRSFSRICYAILFRFSQRPVESYNLLTTPQQDILFSPGRNL
ncbi:MAG: hypothetical protein AB1611_06540 [bacterium]